MHNNWMTCKVKYTKQTESGAFRRVSEAYLFAAMSFTETETRVYEELGSFIKGEFKITGITPTDIHDIFGYDDSSVWYKAVVAYETSDLDSEKQKIVKQNFLVSASSVKEASVRVQESLKGLMVDFTIKSVIETPIVEIFPFKSQD